MTTFVSKIKRLVKDESGAVGVEYGILTAGVGLTLVAALPAIETALSSLLGSVATALTP